MLDNYHSIFCIHSRDKSTLFLESFKNVIPESYHIIDPNIESIQNALEKAEALKSPSLILFLGHGYSNGLYSPTTQPHEKKILVTIDIGEKIFNNHDLILLSCRSSDFLRKLSTYKKAIGFGNIISSVEEVSAEAEYTSKYRDLEEEDIAYFNSSYVRAISESLKLLIGNRISFREISTYISFYINKDINYILRQKGKKNRTELARLLFEFRNDIFYKFFL